MKKFLKLIIILIVIVFGAIVIKANMNSGYLKLDAVEIQPKTVTDSFTESGIVKNGDSFEIISDVTGEILEVYKSENTYVEKGEILAKIDTKDYEYQKLVHQNNISSYISKSSEAVNSESEKKNSYISEIEKLKYELNSIENQKKSTEINKKQQLSEIDKQLNTATGYSIDEKLRVLELAIEVAQNDYNYSKNEYDNNEELYQMGIISKEKLDISKSSFEKAENELKRCQAELESFEKEFQKLQASAQSDTELNEMLYDYKYQNLESSVDSIKSQIELLNKKINADYSSDTVNYYDSLIKNENISISQLNSKIEECTIKSKVSGYIVQLPIKNKTSINVGDIVGIIKSDNNFTVDVKVLTSYVPYLKLNQSVEIIQKLENEDIYYSGKIKEIYNYAVETTSALGIDERRVNVVVEITDSDTNLKDGYEVDVEFETYRQSNQMAVSNSSVFEIEQKDFIFKIENEKAVLTEIEIEHKTNTETVIKNGVNQGDIVVYDANTEGLQDGVQVEPNIVKH